jgi:adenylate cyclase
MARTFVQRAGGIVKTLWRHKGSLLISLVITAGSLAIYYVTFMGERPMPTFDFISRLEYDSYDLRFQLRGRKDPDPRIVIVEIDQHSQEELGHWPFSWHYFAELVHALHEDGAKVVGFDITFSEPDKTGAPLQALNGRLADLQKRGVKPDPLVEREIARLEQHYDYTKEFADAVQRSGGIVLGNYFMFKKREVQGVSEEALKRWADLLGFFPFPQTVPRQPAPADAQARLVEVYALQDLIPLGAEANIPELTNAVAGETGGGTGYFTVTTDSDTVVRRVPLALPYGRDKDFNNWDIYASLDVQVLRVFLGLPNQETVLNYSDAGVSTIEFGPKLIVHPDFISRLLVNYHGPARTYPYVSFADVSEKKFSPGTFKNKIVLVGASATGIGDLRATPFGGLDFPGVEIHANVIDNILNRQFMTRAGEQVMADLGFIFLFGIPLGLLLAVIPPRFMALSLLLLLPFAGVVYWAFLHGWWLNFIMPALFTLLPNAGLVALYRVLVEEGEKRRVRGAFGQYVSPEVIRRLLEEPESVKPRKTSVTVLFSDIRGFTTISESLDAQVMADLLNEYLTEMTKIIFRHRGTLDKYIGDAVMAFWGAPFAEAGHADRCCDTALLMLARLAELQQEWRATGKPPLDIGVGINTGIASVGNMGSSLRYGYTAIGDAVNLAARLEALNKDYGTHILITESTYITLQSERFVTRELDLIQVKGKLLPATIYEVLTTTAVADDGRQLVSTFGRGREAYKIREWRTAKIAFEEVLHRWPEDGPTKVFLSRCSEYIAAEPPTDWDGVYVVQHK